MNVQHRISNQQVIGASVLLAMALSTGCASVPPSCREQHGQITPCLQAAADQYWVYAVLSNNAYERTSPPEMWVAPEHWELLESFSEKLNGRTYLRRPDGKVPTELVIAFRGTKSFGDWKHGDGGDDLYDLAYTYTKQTAEHYRSLYPGIKVVATGHSLGGGLAQHVALCLDGIQAVVFNSSPRVHASRCRVASAIREERIFRIHQHSEVLSWMRHAFRRGEPDVSFDFTKGNFWTRHGIAALTLGLIEVAAHEDSEAEETLSKICAVDPKPSLCAQKPAVPGS